MRGKIVECVPNFSEGRDKKKIEAIAGEIRRVEGAKLLDIDVSPSYNRSVVTFAGSPDAARDAAFSAIAVAADLIDMSQHRGEHPRLGACDVCPFVPIQHVTMDDCTDLAHALGRDVGERLGLSVYLYGEAATLPERRNLATVRAGEYEGLEQKLRDPAWKPDFGPAVFNRKTGAVMIGAREPLIAFNINLRAESRKAADVIAGRIRESGWTLTSSEGKKIRVPGIFKDVKALGVSLDEQRLYQVSTNLTNYKVAPPHEVFEMVKRLSPGLGEVEGSEIVGLVPREAILAAGRFYASAEESEEKLIGLAVENLGLNSLKEFNPREKIIEYMIEED